MKATPVDPVCKAWVGKFPDPPLGKWVDGDFVAIAAVYEHSLAIRRDGSVACWGSNDFGQAPPDGVDGDFVAIAAGHYHSLALRRNGNVACWGRNWHGEAPPEGVTGPFGHTV